MRMENRRNISEKTYELAIVGSTIIWGGAYVVLKGALDSVGAGWLLGLRFLGASLLLALIMHRRLFARLNKLHLVAGAVIGIAGGLAYLTQNIGLANTTPGRNAFFTATYCVMEPFVNWAMTGRRPGLRNVVAALICIVGVGFLSLGDGEGLSFSLSFGDIFTLIGAFFFAVQFVYIGRWAPGCDAMTLTVIELLFQGAVCLSWGIFAEAAPTVDLVTPELLFQFGYLVIFSTIVGITIQNVAQQHVPSTQAALLFSLESVFGTIFSVIFFHEQITAAILTGFVLIFVALVVSELPSRAKPALEAAVEPDAEFEPEA